MSAFDRRSILLGGVTLAGALACRPTQTTKDAGGTQPPEPSQGDEMTIADVLPTLVAVADRLIPSDELGPGAKEAGVEQFLARALADPRMAAIRRMTTRGAVWIARAAKREHGVTFAQLPDDKKDDLIRRLANNQVRPSGFTPPAFVRVMLALTLEAFLGDPRHGGNKDQIGWKFIGGIHWEGRMK